jgi:LVIVD repeat
MRHRTMRSLALVGIATIALGGLAPGVSVAHPEHERGGSAGELFPGEGVASAKQHDGATGHLPPVSSNVELVGKAEVTNPSGAGNTGRIADVTAHGDYAYLNAFYLPTCESTGVHVVDISDPAHPAEVTDAFIPTSRGSYVGEGIQVVHMHNQYFRGDLLIHQNETCPGGTPPPPAPNLLGGISLWNVTDPRHPSPVTLHTGDFTNPAGGVDPAPNTNHSMRAWHNVLDGRTYVVLVDNDEFADVDIMDITDPFHPVLVNDTLDLVELFGVDQPSPAGLSSIFSHDMMIYRVGQRYIMNMNYWDGGYVLLDVTDPRPGRVSLVAETDYAELDEERLARGHSISPEGNSHQSELSPNRKFMIGTDEDFNPFRVFATIDSGPYAGTPFQATQGSDTVPIDEDTTITGPTTFVGLACDPAAVPAGTGVALIERGGCTFQAKFDNIAAKGYTAGIVFNSLQAACQSRLTMLVSGGIPFMFVSRLTGLQLLGVPGVDSHNACTTATPAGAVGHAVTVRAEFDGWGYVRLFATNIPQQAGQPGSIRQIDTYAIPEAQDSSYAYGYGDLSVHEVAMDPDANIAYLSYYAGGFRVVRYGNNGIQEIGAFIDEGGNNFWGVEVWHDEHGSKFVLASDRDYGLYIFRYTG